MGDGDGATTRIDSSLRSAPFRMTCWGAKGDGSPHTRGQRRGGRVLAFRLCGGGLSAGEGGWVPAFARTREGIGRPLGQRVGGFPTTVISRAGSPWGGRGWVPAYARTTRGDGSPHPRGQRVRVDSRFRLHGGRAVRGGRGMAPRIREDTGGGRVLAFRLCEGTLSVGGDGDGSPPPAFAGAGSRREDTGAWGRGTGGSRTAPTEGECCRARSSPPSPVFTRARSPWGGRGWVPASARTREGDGKVSLFGWCNCGIVSRFGRRVCDGGRF